MGKNPTNNYSNRSEIYEVSLELIRALREVVAKIRKHDSDLAKQTRRAASSVSLNLKEGSGRAGGDRVHHFRVARASANEVPGALEVAVAWGYVGPTAVQQALALADRVMAMGYRLTQ